MSLEDDLRKLADATLPDWGDITFSGTQFDNAIRDLYRSHLRFPPSWSEEDCDGYERRHGIRPHHDDASKMIEAARRSAIYELEFDIDVLQEELAGR